MLGTRVARVEDPGFLTVGGRYVGDVDVPGAAHLTFVRSTMAHARLLGVDASAARAASGVVAVFTGEDLDDLPPAPPALAQADSRMRRPYLATDTVRFAGETVAVVVSETPAEGVDAAELVTIDYEPLAVVVDPETALEGEALLFPEAESNVASEIPWGPEPPDGDLFAGCDVVVEARLVNQKMAVAPLEPRSCAAHWDDGRLTQWSCCQGAHPVMAALRKAFGLPRGQVRVLVPDVGGAFGGKGGNYPEEILTAWTARRLARPTRWTETRTEHMLAFSPGRAQVHYATLGGRRDGALLAYRLRVVQDIGAYPSTFGAMMPGMTRLMASGTYVIPKVSYTAQSVVTNTTPVGAFRGAGRPEAAAAIERMVDLFADEAGLDPLEVRRRNHIPAADFPHTTPTGASLDSGAYTEALDLAASTAGYHDLRGEQRRRREAGDPTLLGVGVASYVEVTNPGGTGEYGAVEVHPDGSATVRTGSSPHGQGHVTAWSMLASEATGIPLERITVRYGDTDLVPRGGITGGSRSLQAAGSAVWEASGQLVERARQLAADRLEASVDDVVLDRPSAAFHVTGSPSPRLTWSELASAAPEPLSAEVDSPAPGSTFPFGAHVAVVEIDSETGRVTLRRLVAVDDAGRRLNPLIVEGQIHGGVAAGVAQALIEEVRYDEEGNLLTSNFADYGFISAPELPSFELAPMETPSPRNPLGAKGIGESGAIGATPAVQNAVVDALSHLGVRHVDLPLTSQRVWEALRVAGRR
jgi:carbon-monoxide dehydrogenase large subunit